MNVIFASFFQRRHILMVCFLSALQITDLATLLHSRQLYYLTDFTLHVIHYWYKTIDYCCINYTHSLECIGYLVWIFKTGLYTESNSQKERV